MKKTEFFTLAGLLAAIAFSAQAVPLRGLYEASVPVPDQSPRTREQALQQALQTVLIRITGSRQLPVETGVPLLNRASSLVQNYGYETNTKGLRPFPKPDRRMPILTLLRDTYSQTSRISNPLVTGSLDGRRPEYDDIKRALAGLKLRVPLIGGWIVIS